MAKDKPICEQAVPFAKHHLGKNCFAPCTGQDYRLISAFAHLTSAWCACDSEGAVHVENAMYECVLAVQPKILPLLKAVAVAAADWDMVDKLFCRLIERADEHALRRQDAKFSNQVNELCGHHFHSRDFRRKD